MTIATQQEPQTTRPTSLRDLCGIPLWLLLAGCFAHPAFASTPVIDRIDQSTGGQRGTEFSLRVEGYNLQDVADILFFEPGVEMQSIERPEDGVIEVNLFATPTCRLGEHPFVLSSPRATSEVRTFHIGPFAVAQEQEPNSSLESAQPIAIPATVTGIVEETDEDWFQVELRAGQRLSAEVVAMPLSRYLFDSLLELFDASGQLLQKSDDHPLLRQDPVLNFVADEDGHYFIRIREAAFGGDLDSRYRIHIGDFPRPTVAYPAGMPSNQETSVQLLGDAMGASETQIQLDHRVGATIPFNVSRSDDSPCYVRLRASEVPNLLEHEPNDDIASGTRSPDGTRIALNGVLSAPGDVDFFQFDAQAGQAFEVQTFAARLGSPLDTVLTLYDPDGRVLSRNDDGFVHDSLIRFVVPTTGTYAISVRDQLDRGATTGVYRIEFNPARPKLDLRLPTTSGSMPQQLQSVVVPRGATVPLLVSCRRQNFKAPVQLKIDNHPEGIEFTSDPIESESHLAVSLFRASDTAPLGTNLVTLFGTADVSDGTVYGTLTQKVGLVFGQPRKTVYHEVELDQFPVQVVDAAPFRVSVVQPTSPLVQQGRLDLQVTVERSSTFTGAVTLSLAQAPPWVRGPEEPVVMDANMASGSFSLFADSNAAIRDWTIVLAAQAETSHGPMLIAAEPIRLRVALPYASLAIDKTIVRQDSDGSVRCRLAWRDGHRPAAFAKLHGLPKGARSEQQRLTPGQTDIAFPLAIASDTPAAAHNTLYVELTVPEASESVAHFLGHGGVLEVLEPGATPQEEESRLQVLRHSRRSENDDEY